MQSTDAGRPAPTSDRPTRRGREVSSLAAYASPPRPPQASPVKDFIMTTASAPFRFWINMAMECVRRDHTPAISAGDQRGPFLSARAQGMALAALHDVHAIVAGATPLLTVPGAPGLAGLNGTVAAAAACDQVLRLRYPKQVRFLAPAWADWLDVNGLAVGHEPSEQAGRLFGAAVHAIGVQDPTHGQAGQYMPSGAPYTHQRPAHEPTQGFAGGLWGQAVPLMVPVVPNFPKPPGRISGVQVEPTAHYAQDLEEVKRLGAAIPGPNGRSLDQEQIGIYWGYDGPPELGTPPRLYLQVVLEVLDNIEARQPGKLSELEELRIVAAVAVAMADAGISAWYYKYSADHMMWRPVVGIPKALPGNGVADLGWLPLGRPDTNGSGQTLSPDFPAYPSGHATFGAAAFHLLRLMLVEKGLGAFADDGMGEDDIGFEFQSDEYDGRNIDPRTMAPRAPFTRGYASLWKAIVDNSISRVFLGVHWYFDGLTVLDSDNKDAFGIPGKPAETGRTGGVWLGARIANTIAASPAVGVTAQTIDAGKLGL